MAAVTVSDLPESILLQILEWLPLRERLGVARVCRRWRRLVQDKLLWRDVDLTPYTMSSRVLWHLLRKYFRGNLRMLKAQGTLHSIRKQEVFSPALMRALGTQCPHLHYLCLVKADLRSLSYDCMPSSLTTLVLKCCRLPLLWFQGPDSSEASQTIPQLQHLIIQNIIAFSDRHLVNVASQGTLKILFLSEAYLVTDDGFQIAAPQLGNLESLSLHDCSTSDSTVHFIGRHMKRLRHLDLIGRSCPTDAALPCLSSLASLEDLLLGDCDTLSPETIIATCQALPELKYLDISRMPFNNRMIHQIEASLPDCEVTYTTSN